eukprot:11205405-Alexandrium_andersonii.AAC.1
MSLFLAAHRPFGQKVAAGRRCKVPLRGGHRPRGPPQKAPPSRRMRFFFGRGPGGREPRPVRPLAPEAPVGGIS